MTKFPNHTRRYFGKMLEIAPRDVQFVPLQGATSSELFRVVSTQNPDTPLAVLRVLNNANWLREEPDLASHEAHALMELEALEVRAPQLLNYENGSDIVGVPFVFMTYLRGEVQLKPRDLGAYLDKLAAQLTQIHRHRAPDFRWHYGSYLELETLQIPNWAQQPNLWRRAIEIARQSPPSDETVFIHRDFHPVNVLWQNEKISGVVDWINSCQGPAGVDVAHCRTNLAILFGLEAADEFLKCYENYAGKRQNQAYWDVCSVLDVALPAPQWYRPWSEFGLAQMPVEAMQQRDEEHLCRVLERL